MGAPFLSSYPAPPYFFLVNKTPTLASDDVHFERGMVVPGLHMEAQEPGRHGVLQVGDLHSVAVRVATQQLNKRKIGSVSEMFGVVGVTFLSP